MAEDYTQTWLQDLAYKIDNLSLAIYGNQKVPNGGGVYGEIRRMREEAKSNSQNRNDQMKGLEEQIKRLDERIDAMDKRLRPRWWDYVIMGGAVVLAAVLILQVLTILGHIG